jgi:hypothetical protein
METARNMKKRAPMAYRLYCLWLRLHPEDAQGIFLLAEKCYEAGWNAAIDAIKKDVGKMKRPVWKPVVRPYKMPSRAELLASPDENQGSSQRSVARRRQP